MVSFPTCKVHWEVMSKQMEFEAGELSKESFTIRKGYLKA